MTVRQGLLAALVLAGPGLLSGCNFSSSSGDNGPGDGRPGLPECPVARLVTDQADLIGGSPVARGRVGDYLIANDRIRAIVRKAGRQWIGGVNPYGGTIVDADVQRPRGERGKVHFEASSLGVNIETLPNYQDVTILNDGSNCEPAVIRATGPLDLFEYANGSSAIRGMGLTFPDSADDRPLPSIQVQTDYILAMGDDYVREETTLFNSAGQAQDIYLVEYLSGSGLVDAFIPGTGFGEPLATTTCPVTKWVACDASGSCDPCNFLAFAGYGEGGDLAYGRIHPYFGSSTINLTGINVIAYRAEFLEVVLGLQPPNFTVPANGSLDITRYFAVTRGSVNDVQRVRDGIFGVRSGAVSGAVTSGGEPVADVAVVATRPNLELEALTLDQPDVLGLLDGVSLDRLLGLVDGVVADPVPSGIVFAPALDVVSQTRTDAEGRYRLELPPGGDYEIRVHKEGWPRSQPGAAAVAVARGDEITRDFELPAPGHLQVTVRDAAGAPIPAKVQLVGIDPNRPLANSQSILGLVETRAGVFFDQFVRDPLPFGIALVGFAGADGQMPRQTIEPGEYELVVSRGPRYSAHRERITIAPGTVAAAEARLAKVVETPGFVAADFHVHGIDSVDSRIPREDRVAAYLAEGMDFFTPSDHGVQVDFGPLLREMGVADLLGTATSAELTTFDYGHFNAWPRTFDPDDLAGGSTDWGWRDVEAGRRFPAFGNYLSSPEELIARAKNDPLEPVVQINHIDSFFGPNGLGVDTGQAPPQSTVDPASRRLDPGIANHFSDAFDALEIWIGVNGREGAGSLLLTNMGDWFNLLNQGIVRTAVGSSDTHVLRLTSLSTRSLVASEVTDPGALSGHAQALATNVADGRVVVSNAPFLTVELAHPDTGAVAGLGVGEARLLSSPDGRANVRLTVASPAWAQFDRIELFVNSAPAPAGGDTPRYRACPDITLRAGEDFTVTETVVDPDVPGARRLAAEVTVSLENLAEDTWIVARVAGSDGVSEPLFPVVPNDLAAGGNQDLDGLTDGNLGEGGVLANAVSNALFVDVDGDGEWSPPGVRNNACN